ncbi:MAG: DNA polymerase, partial [Sandaracinaceae bacterium]
MPAALPKPGDPEVLYVMDLMGFVFRAYHALPPMSTRSGEPTHAVYGVTQMILALVEQQKPHLLAVALDPSGPTFRHGIYPDYKANRREHPEDLRPQIARLSDVLEAYAIPRFLEPGFEADDLIATLVKKARAAGLRVVIVAADKDLLQLVADDVLMYDTMREVVYGPAEAEIKLGVPPKKVAQYLALVGDSSDNVPGVRSVGPKTAAQLLSTYESVADIYAHLDDIPKKGVREKLREQKAQAELSLELVSLRDDVPIELDLKALEYGGADHARLAKLFTDLEFVRLLPRLKSTPATTTPARPQKLAKVQIVTDEIALEAQLAEARASGRLGVFSLVEDDDARSGAIAGIGLASAGRVAYVPIGHLYLGAPKQLTLDATLAALAPVLGDPKVELVLADSKRERLVFDRFGIPLDRVGFDASLASYLVDPERHGHTVEEIAKAELGRELAPYDALTDKKRGTRRAVTDLEVEAAGEHAARRAEVALEVRSAMSARLEAEGLSALLGEVELPLARELAAMEHRGVAVDVPLLERLSAEYGDRIRSLEERAFVLAGHPFKINSPRALEEVLFDELKLPVVKKTRTSRSTDHDVLEELRHAHALPEVILEHRSLQKLKGTYLDALPKAVDPETGRIHTRFNQAFAATGRMISSDPNLQKIPIRTE